MRRTGGPAATVLALLLAVVALAACSEGRAERSGQTPSAAPAPSPPPELEREWQVTAFATIPQSWNERFWWTDWTYVAGPARTTSPVGTGLKLFDARTGERVRLDLPGDPCDVPELHPGDTHAVLLVSDPDAPPADPRLPASWQSGPCDGLVVYDMTTGTKAWEWPTGSRGRFQLDFKTKRGVVVTWPDGSSDCFALADGRRLRTCGRLTGQLPQLLDEHGAPLMELGGQQEIARRDGVVVVKGSLPDMSVLVRAHDLETGVTLWVDAAEPDPGPSTAWDRTETYAASPDSLLRIRYEFEDAELAAGDDETPGSPVPTFAFISRVDPRTGEDLGEVGKVAGGLFLAQVGDVAVMGVDQERGLKARLAGFRVPATG